MRSYADGHPVVGASITGGCIRTVDPWVDMDDLPIRFK